MQVAQNLSARPTTRCSSMAASAWARPTWFAIGNAVFKHNPRGHPLCTRRGLLRRRGARLSAEELRRLQALLPLARRADHRRHPFFNNKNRTQEEFFHAFNALTGRERSRSSSPATPTPRTSRAWKTASFPRFDWGLTVQIRPPELEMRVAILKKKAEALECGRRRRRLPDRQNLRSNVRELEGALNKVARLRRFHGRQIGLEWPRSAQDLLRAHNRQLVHRAHPEDRRRLLQDQGRRHVLEEAHARHRAPAPGGDVAGKELTPMSLPAIGGSLRRARPHHRAARLPHHHRCCASATTNSTTTSCVRPGDCRSCGLSRF